MDGQHMNKNKINYDFEIHELDFHWKMFEKTKDPFWIRILIAWCKDFRRNNF